MEETGWKYWIGSHLTRKFEISIIRFTDYHRLLIAKCSYKNLMIILSREYPLDDEFFQCVLQCIKRVLVGFN